MPFINGVRVSNDEWIESKTGKPVGWMEVTGYQYGDEPAPVSGESTEEEIAEDKAPAPRRRGRNKKAAAEKAIAAATGVVVDLDEGAEEAVETAPQDDGIDATLVDTSGFDNEDPTSSDAEAE